MRPLRVALRLSVPPEGIAADAFITSAITTCFSEPASIRTRGSVLGRLARTRSRASAG